MDCDSSLIRLLSTNKSPLHKQAASQMSNFVNIVSRCYIRIGCKAG
jgi:hypothetical protein